MTRKPSKTEAPGADVPRLTVKAVAEFSGAYHGTVRGYDREGRVVPIRDSRGVRLYTMAQAEEVRRLVTERRARFPGKKPA